MAEIVILGAGLCGLSSAYHLEKNRFFNYKLFEMEEKPGGLCRSVQQDGFIFDYTGHLIHINNEYFATFINNILGSKNLNRITRRSFIYSHDTYTKYPFQINLHGLPTSVIVACIKGFLQQKRTIKHPKNFHQWVLKYFGSGIGKHFLFPYNKKLLNFNLKKLHPTWTGRFMPATTLDIMLHGALGDHPENSIGYNAYFWYPKKKGINYFPHQLQKTLRNKIYTGFKAIRIDLASKHLYFENGHVEPYKKLITTLPLTTLLGILKEPSRSSMHHACRKLLCTSLINFNLGINIPNVSDKHWIYFPEKRFLFYRIGFWNNFSSSMAPIGCSSIYGEVSYMPGTKTKKQIDNLAKKSIEQTLQVFGLERRHIVTENLLYLPHAYVIYDKWRQKNISKLLQRMQKFGIYSQGRFGAWKYSSMQEAIIDGRNVAHMLLQEKPFAIFGTAKTTHPFQTPSIHDLPCAKPNLPAHRKKIPVEPY